MLISREITSKLLTFESYLSSQSSLRLSVSNCPSGLGLLFDVSAEAVTVVYEAMDQGEIAQENRITRVATKRTTQSGPVDGNSSRFLRCQKICAEDCCFQMP